MAFELDGSVIIDDSRNVVAGAAATFTYLEAATAQITGDYINIDGNLDVAQDIRHLGDSDTKIFFGDNSVTVATAGQNNVGIGTNLTTLTSPSGTDTTVRLQHQGNSGYGNIILDRTANAFIIDNDPTNASSNQSYFSVKNKGVENLHIDSSGNVGIGSDTLTSQLEIKRGNVGSYPNGNAKPTGASIWNDGGDIFSGRLFLQGSALSANASFLTGFNNEGTGLVLYDYSQANYMQKWFKEAQTELYYNGTQRFRTTDVGVTIYEDTDKVVRFTGGIGEIGSVTGFQATNTAGSALVDFGMRATSLRFATGASERLRIDDSGRTLIGHTSSLSEGCLLQVVRANDNTVELFGYSANANGARINFTKSRDATIGTNTIVQDGDTIGELHFRAANGDGQYYRVAAIEAEMDGGVGVSSVPGRLIFATTPAGATTQTERMRIGSTGAVSIGGNAAASRFNVIGQNAPQSGSINPGTISDALAMFYGGKRTTIATNNHIDNAIIHIKGQITDNDTNSTGTWTTGQIVFSGRRARGAQAIIENNTVWNYSNQTAGSELWFYTAEESSNGETAPVERMRITPGGVINFGHGATTNLHGSTTAGINLNGNGNSGQIIANASSNRALIIGRQSDYGQVIEFFQGTNTNEAAITIPAADSFGIETAGTERLRITSTGNVGVGTNAPYANASYNSLSVGGSKKGLIEINDDSDVPRAHLYTDGGDFKVSTVGTAGTIRFITGGTLVEHLTIASGGNVTTTGNSTFSRGDAGFTARKGDCVSVTRAGGTPLEITRTTAQGNMINFFDTDASTQRANIQLNTNDLVFGLTSEKFRITTGGQLLATSAADVRLTLGSSGTSGSNDSVHIRADSADLKFMAADGGSTIFETNGTETLKIDSEGKTFIDRTVSSTSGNHPALEIETICSGSEDTTFATGIDFKVDGVHKKRLAVTDGTGEGGGDWIFYRDHGTNEALRIHSTGQLELKVPDSVSTLKLTPSGTNAPATIDFNTPGNGSAVFKVQGSQKLGITTEGQVQFSNGSFASNIDSICANGGTMDIGAQSTLKFRTATNERLSIDSDGRVNIGQASDTDHTLCVAGTDNTTSLTDGHTQGIQLQNKSTTDGTYSQIEWRTSSGGRYARIAGIQDDANGNGGQLVFLTETSGGTTTEALRIQNDGNVGIASESPSALLDVGNTGIATASSVINAQAWEGQVFNVDGNLSSDSIFAVNDISGLPVIDYNATHAKLSLAPFGGNVSIGYTNAGTKLGLKGSTSERVYIVADKLSTSDTVNIDNGNVQYFSTDNDNQSNMTTNITSNNGINNDLAVGDSTTVIIIIKPEATDDKITAITIDGSAATIQWLDGTAPTGGTSGDYDLYSFFILKTDDATFTTFGNKVKYT